MIDRLKSLSILLAGTTAVVFATATGTVAAKPAAASIKWSADFDAALAEARRLNRPLIVHFYADWCGPCRRMERETLNSTALARQTRGRFLAVKVNTDKNPKVAKRYNVSTLPADVFLDPGGRILARATGYQSSRQYLSRVAHVESTFVKSQKTLVAKKRSSQPPASNPKKSLPRKADTQPNARSRTTPSISRKTKTSPAIGMGGYSPIALWNHRKWVEGKPAFAHQFQGVTFYLADAQELRQFRANPERYAPKLLGCDPVILNETDRAIAGKIDYGAYFDGELFFFVDDASRQKFRAKPLRYTRTRHVLRIDHVGGTVRR